MVLLDLLTIAGLPTAVGASEAVHQQQLLDEEAEAPERQEPFYLDVYCDAQSRKREEVHGAIIVLKDGKLRLWPKDSKTGLPKEDPDSGETPHPFTGFFYPFPTENLDLPHRPMPAPPILGLVSTIPASPKAKSNTMRPKLNWIYADSETRELKYGPRSEAKHHTVGPWDWTEDEQGLTLEDEESLVAVEEEKGGYGWAVYWDREDDRLKQWGVLEEKRVLRCSLERRLVEEKEMGGLDDL
ncbi:hypothetical protein BU25DRAFT_410836 [Macroventuria anomochaeta]|uniref:Uncharacterized protein n=1 Tax=Macroventuria anomochaeta TaxID=301207 RepID=A0ACB6S0L8_9PLEO|nr:uncharacterized protein BU25DRAFT_410836 [Macroventuria anomochaeta]KAF2627701.1 hypothetical protein BU25DRAFT_410836 [Macroventuria anomochaeta]